MSAGVALGIVMSKANTSDCCKRVAGAVREEVTDRYGEGAGTLGDMFGIWQRAPGVLDWFGVPS